MLEDEDSHPAIVRTRRTSGHNGSREVRRTSRRSSSLGTLTSSVRAVTPTAFHSSIRRLSADQRSLLAVRSWRPGCPVPRKDLRLLTLTHVGFDGRAACRAARRQPRRRETTRQRLSSALRAALSHPAHASARFLRRPDRIPEGSRHHRVVRVPAIGAFALHGWHPIGPLVESRLWACHRPEPAREPLRRLRDDPRSERARVPRSDPSSKGMVTPEVIRAFASVGWGWGGSWSGSTKDYMHFSTNGH